MADFENGTKQLELMNIDKRILRYLVIDCEKMKTSTAIKDPLGCKYIYVKSGMQDNLVGVSNIDCVQLIYASHGINLKKHTSHLDDKASEVLVIGISDILKLNETQQNFLNETAPDNVIYDSEANRRMVGIINQIYLANHRGERG